jgi:hypothetical protein
LQFFQFNLREGLGWLMNRCPHKKGNKFSLKNLLKISDFNHFFRIFLLEKNSFFMGAPIHQPPRSFCTSKKGSKEVLQLLYNSKFRFLNTIIFCLNMELHGMEVAVRPPNWRSKLPLIETERITPTPFIPFLG